MTPKLTPKRVFLTPLFALLCATSAHAIAPHDRWVDGDVAFVCREISDSLRFIMLQMQSVREGVAKGLVVWDDLRHLRVLHKDAEGVVHRGEMVVNKSIAKDVLEIFFKLYEAGYPIERMCLMDRYNGDDEASMCDNNTSSFNFRMVEGATSLSRHARGMAVDINPLYNPCVRQRSGQTQVQPATARPYIDRTTPSPYILRRGDLCHTLFVQHGFRWGGAWRSLKDYQHFEK